VKKEDGEDYEAFCWPGRTTWLDFFNQECRDFLGDVYSGKAKHPEVSDNDFLWSDPNMQVWLDMVEPAIFTNTEKTMPKTNKHTLTQGDKQLEVSHRDVHSLYGHYGAKAHYEGLLKRSEERPFVLNRAFFAGSQRYAVHWTGDPRCDWGHFKITIP